MKLRLIAEGSTKKERKSLRWGISFLIGDVLFDTFGREDIFRGNIRKFRIDLSRVRRVVISHEDWDHIGGLKSFLQACPRAKVFLCKKTGKDLREFLRTVCVTPVWVDKPRKISKNIFSLGPMRADTGRGILYEQALVVKSPKGFSVMTGCAHPGIVEIVKRAIQVFGKNIYAVGGGFHMKDHSREENLKIIAELQALGVRKVIPLHCTGARAYRLFHRNFGKHCIRMREGSTVIL